MRSWRLRSGRIVTGVLIAAAFMLGSATYGGVCRSKWDKETNATSSAAAAKTPGTPGPPLDVTAKLLHEAATI